MDFAPARPSQLEEIAALLQASFHAKADEPFLDRALLRWKYFEPGPSLAGTRSYVLSESGRILAHAAVWPLKVRLGGELRTGIGFGDWAASEEHRGIGLMLLKKLTTLASFILVIGGAEITRQILPRVGFDPWAALPAYAKVLRPFAQVSARPAMLGWKEPARLARNMSWSLKPSAATGDWIATYAPPDEHALAMTSDQAGSIHDKEFLTYLLRCPAVSIRYVALSKGGKARGYAVVSAVGMQRRIADLRIVADRDEDYSSAIAALLKLLKGERTAAEAIAIASVPYWERAFEANRFQLRDKRPLVILDGEKKMAKEPVPQLGMLEDDSVFLQTPKFPFLT